MYRSPSILPAVRRVGWWADAGEERSLPVPAGGDHVGGFSAHHTHGLSLGETLPGGPVVWLVLWTGTGRLPGEVVSNRSIMLGVRSKGFGYGLRTIAGEEFNPILKGLGV